MGEDTLEFRDDGPLRNVHSAFSLSGMCIRAGDNMGLEALQPDGTRRQISIIPYNSGSSRPCQHINCSLLPIDSGVPNARFRRASMSICRFAKDILEQCEWMRDLMGALPQILHLLLRIIKLSI